MGEIAKQAVSGAGRVRYGEGRQALIEAAVRLVAREGLSRLTTRTLIAESGVSQGSLHHHFGSVQDILGAGLDYCGDVSLAYLNSSASFAAVFEQMLVFFRERPDVAAFRTEVFLEARRRPPIRDLVRAHQDRFADVIRSVLMTLDIAPDEALVAFLTGAVYGFAYQIAVFGDAQLPATEQQFAVLQRLLAAADSEEAVSRRS